MTGKSLTFNDPQLFSQCEPTTCPGHCQGKDREEVEGQFLAANQVPLQ